MFIPALTQLKMSTGATPLLALAMGVQTAEIFLLPSSFLSSYDRKEHPTAVVGAENR
jgi:hypothetical protein